MQEFIIQNGILREYTGPGGDITIPDGVRTIGPFAFSDYDDVWAEEREWNVTSVDIPESVRRIENYAFAGRAETLYVTVPPSVVFFGESVFEDCSSLTLIVAPGSAAEGYARWQGIAYRYTK